MNVTSWLLHTSVEVSLVVVVILILRPLVRRIIDARAAYRLWLLIPVVLLLPDLPILPQSVPDLGLVMSTGEWLPDRVETETVGLGPWGVGWLIGMVLWLFWRIGRHVSFRAEVTADARLLDAEEVFSCGIAREHSGQSARIFALAPNSGEAYSPFAMGLWRPGIYLPHDFDNRFDSEQQRWVIHHESVHIRRGDLWVQLIAELLRAGFWFNPLMHLAHLALRRDQELACDQVVLAHASRAQRIQYGETLLLAATHASRGASQSLALSFFKIHKERFTMLAKHKSTNTRTLLGYVLLGLLSFAILTSPTAMVAGGLDDKPLTLRFEQIAAPKLLDMIGNYVGVEFEGVELLRDLRIDVTANNVSAREALDEILRCRGYDFSEQADARVKIVALEEVSQEGTCAD